MAQRDLGTRNCTADMQEMGLDLEYLGFLCIPLCDSNYRKTRDPFE